MGWHIHAYYDIDQLEFEKLIREHNLNHQKWEDADAIAVLYKRHHGLPLDDSVYLIYHWNSDCHLHELYEIYSVNFIRDDDRLSNPRFHKELEKRLGRPFPQCLKRICWDLSTREDAIEIADELNVFFPDDDGLTYFAHWLKRTARVCSTYDLSY